MAKKLPLFVGWQPFSELINSGLPECRWEEALEPFSLSTVMGKTDIKKLLRQSAYEKCLFLREAKILNDLSNDHSPNKRFLLKSISHNAGVSLFRCWTFWCKFLYQMTSVQARCFTIDGF